MNKHSAICLVGLGFGLGLGVLPGLAGKAEAAQIILDQTAVIGSTGGFDGRFGAENILDRQTGAISETFGNGEYWLNPDGRTPAFITIDLGALYRLGSFDLFNSRNLGDRATAGFEIYAANSTQAATGAGATGLTLGSDATRLVAGTLALDPTSATINAQSFAALDLGQSYRFLQFRPVSPINSAYGGAAYGLNELRVFEYVAPLSGVPEPSTWVMMIGGLGMTGVALRNRRQRLAFA